MKLVFTWKNLQIGKQRTAFKDLVVPPFVKVLAEDNVVLDSRVLDPGLLRNVGDVANGVDHARFLLKKITIAFSFLKIFFMSLYCVCRNTRKGLQKNEEIRESVKILCENLRKCFGAKMKNKWVGQLFDPSIFYKCMFTK